VAQVTQKRLEVRGACVRLAQQHTPAIAHVQRAKKRALGVVAADRNLGLLTARGPRRPQGRQQTQGRFIFGQEHRALRPLL
jgi:hypothetical protein